MRVFQGNGISVDGIHVDLGRKTKAPNKAVISHAHSDHVCLNESTSFYLTRETKDLVDKRYGKVSNPLPLKIGEKTRVNGATLSLHNAGHILGSSQTLVENSSSVVYTSDFKLQDSLLLKGALPLQSDVLIMESTFGLPSYSFPKRDTLYEEIGSWVKKNSKKGFVVLAGYSLGKAQELTKIVNEYTDSVPLVHEAIFENNEIYKKHGKKMGNYLLLNHNLKDSNVAILPPSLARQGLLQAIGYTVKKPVKSAMATSGVAVHVLPLYLLTPPVVPNQKTPAVSTYIELISLLASPSAVVYVVQVLPSYLVRPP